MSKFGAIGHETYSLYTIMHASQKPLVFSLFGMLAVFGGALIYFTMEYLSSVPQADAPQSSETIYQVGLILLVVAIMAGFPAVGMGAYVMYIGSRIRATGQWPPAGMGFRAQAPILLGSRTDLMGWAAMGLGGILVAVGLLLPLWGWYLVTVLFPDFWK